MAEPIVCRPTKEPHSWFVRCWAAAGTFFGGYAAYRFWRGDSAGGYVLLAGCLVMAMAVAAVIVGWRSGRRRRVIVDLEHETVVFKGFRVVRSFWWNPTLPEFRCHLSEILDAHFIANPNGLHSLRVVTKRGVVSVSSGMSHFDDLCEILSAASKETPRGPIYENPRFLLLLVFLFAAALVIGLFCWEWANG